MLFPSVIFYLFVQINVKKSKKFPALRAGFSFYLFLSLPLSLSSLISLSSHLSPFSLSSLLLTHYIPLHCITLHSLHSLSLFLDGRLRFCAEKRGFAILSRALKLLCISMHYIAKTLHHITMHYIAMHYISLHCNTFHHITITLHYITLHYKGKFSKSY